MTRKNGHLAAIVGAAIILFLNVILLAQIFGLPLPFLG